MMHLIPMAVDWVSSVIENSRQWGRPLTRAESRIGAMYEAVKALLQAGAQASTDWASDSYPGEWPQAWDSPCFDGFNEGDETARAVYYLLLLSRPSPWSDKVKERAEIAEAQEALRAWLEKRDRP